MTTKRIKEEIKSFLPGIVLGFTALILIVVSSVLFSKNAENRLEIKTQNDQLTLLNSRLKSLESYSTNQNEILIDKQLFDSILTSDPSVPVVLTQVQQLAIDSGVSLSALQFAPTGTATTGSSSIGIQVSVSGSYNNVTSFLRNVENCGRLLSVTSLRLSSSSTTTGSAPTTSQTVTATLSLINPYYTKATTKAASTQDLKNPAFMKMVALLRSFKIYAPRVDNSGIGKSNPFQ